MIKSMTAYATVEKSSQDFSISIEFRTYNSRHLDMSLRLPHGYAVLEDKIKAMLTAHLVRGRIEVRLSYQDTSEAAFAYEVDMVKAEAYLTAVEKLKTLPRLSSGDISVDHLAAVGGLIYPADKNRSVENHWPFIADALAEALSNLDEMRSREGEFIGHDIARRLDGIEKRLNRIEAATDGLLTYYRDKLQARIASLTQEFIPLDPVRILQEAAILADRSDISEEIVRSRSHLVQFKKIMDSAEPSGRKLNFLLQEFNREFNTMGAKVGQADIAHIIVDIKAELEKIREQIQNIE
jgi:uncharacterized protein (TIGR00255 family)